LAARPVEPRYTFETFCEGAPNRVALQRKSGVESWPARPASQPALIHAGSAAQDASPPRHHARRAPCGAGRKVVYLTATFHVPLRRGAPQSVGDPFKKASARSTLLLIDDMQFLQGKSVQQNFLATCSTP